MDVEYVCGDVEYVCGDVECGDVECVCGDVECVCGDGECGDVEYVCGVWVVKYVYWGLPDDINHYRDIPLPLSLHCCK